MNAILGNKVGMTEVFDEETGKAVAVTVIEAEPGVVIRRKTQDSDGYDSLVAGFGKAGGNILQPNEGEFTTRKLEPKRNVMEIRGEFPEEIATGTEIKLDIFAPGDFVDVTGTTKGRGFTGVVKRWGMKGGRASHGCEKKHRTPGSIGAGTDPGNIWKGHHLPGHYGNEKCSIQNLRVVKVDTENNLIAISGAVPGPRSGLVLIRKAVKKAQ